MQNEWRGHGHITRPQLNPYFSLVWAQSRPKNTHGIVDVAIFSSAQQLMSKPKNVVQQNLKIIKQQKLDKVNPI